MKRSRKIACLVLAIAMIATAMLSGCSPAGGGDDANRKLVWYTFGTKQPDHDKVVAEANKIIKEELGFEIDYNVVDGSSYEQKINLAVSAGEKFDLCFTASWMNNFNNNAAKGAFTEITDELLAENAPELKGLYPDWFMDGGLYGGKLYAVPNYQLVAIPPGYNIQKELADKYNLDVSTIKNWKDIEPFLAQVKEGEPNLFPISPGYDPFSLDFDNIGFERQLWAKKGDPEHKVMARCDIPEAKELLEFWSGWYEKGYIRSDLLTSEEGEATDQANNKYAVIMNTIKPGGEGDLKLKTGKDYVPVVVGEAEITSGATVVTMLGISSTSPDPGKAMQLINLLHTNKDLYNMLIFGLENEHYTVEQEDPKVVKVAEDSKYSMSATNAWTFGNQFNAYYRDDQTVGSWEESDKLNRSMKVSTYYGFTFDNTAVKNEIAKVAAVFNEYHFERIYARANWQEAYNEYVQKVKAAGVDKMVEESQKQVNEWFATKQ